MSRSTPKRIPWRPLWAGALAALLVLLWAGLSESRTEPPDREQLVHAFGPIRFSEGRITGGFPWAPVDKRRVVPTEELRGVTRSLQSSPARKSPAVLGNLGVLALADAHPSLAVKLFEQASSKVPSDASFLVDLSAALLSTAESEKNSYLFFKALDISRQALRINPASSEAIFNHALAADRLHLILIAREAWKDFLDVETDPQWRDEAAHRLKNLQEPTAGERWLILKGKLEIETSQSYDSLIREVIEEFPQQLRQWAQEDLLEKWARACESGAYQEADRHRQAVSSIGRSLAEKRGELSVLDSSSAISQGSCEQMSRLVAGHKAYARGVYLYNHSQYSKAAIPLREAEQAFDETGSRAALLWTRLWLGGTEYYNRRHDEAEAEFTAILNDPSSAKFPALQGRALWCRGQLSLVHGDLENALSLFGQARTLFERLGEMENAGAMNALRADALRRAGRQDEAWSERFQALGRLSQYPGSYRLHNLLFEAPDALLSTGLEFAAQEFQSEGARVATKFSGKPSNITANLLFGARLRARWDEEGALSALKQARDSMRRIEDSELRESFWFESVLTEQEIYSKISSSRKSLSPYLSRVIQYYEDLRQPVNAADARLLRARSEIQAGDLAAAENDLTIGVGYQEAMAKEVTDQAAFAEEWQDLFEEMVRLNAVFRQDPERAFEFVEKSHIPPCQTAAHLPCIRVRSLEEVRASIPEGLALLQYFVLPERLLIWRFYAGEVKFWETPLDSERLRVCIESFVRDIQEGRDSEGGRIFYDLLLRNPLKGLPPETELMLVPDRALNRVPFAALWDRQRSRYMVEDHPLGYEPSASQFLADLDRTPARSSAPSSITAIGFGNPSLSGRLGARFLRLPFAEPEATGVAEIYPERKVLIGVAATRSAFAKALEESEIVHFAGHGLFNSESPLLSGIVLANDDPAKDGTVFSPRDIPNLRTSRLRLLVLSACETSPGSGRRVDGLNGIAAAFLVRGVPAILSAQWSVDDSVSREFLLYFHNWLLLGISPREALKKSQVAYLRGNDGLSKNPALWASYRFTGQMP